MTKLSAQLLREFGYSPEEMLMSPHTQVVDKAENWAEMVAAWGISFEQKYKKFEALSLFLARQDQSGNWLPV